MKKKMFKNVDVFGIKKDYEVTYHKDSYKIEDITFPMILVPSKSKGKLKFKVNCKDKP
jgi:predicted ATP-grasp superfamily ATP-dependent carboligase